MISHTIRRICRLALAGAMGLGVAGALSGCASGDKDRKDGGAGGGGGGSGGGAAAQASTPAPATKPAAAADAAGWKPLFDGKTLDGWIVADYAGHGEPKVRPDGVVVIPMGDSLTGLTYTRPTPTTSYEVSLEAQRADGNDFFCGLTFPVDKSHASLILGGWGGSVVGISSIDGRDASENESSTTMGFEDKKWYRVRLRVLPTRLQAWVDDEQLIDVDIKGRQVSTRADIDESKPFGLATWRTTGWFRNVKIRELTDEEVRRGEEEAAKKREE